MVVTIVVIISWNTYGNYSGINDGNDIVNKPVTIGLKKP